MDTRSLCEHIEKDISKLERPAIIGINGAITSGKTTLALALDRFLRERKVHTQLIHMDDFHHPRAIRFGDLTIENYFLNAMDLEKFSELILEIKRHPVNKTMTLLDMNTDTYVNQQVYTTGMNSVVIVEGVLLYRPPIEHLFDYRVFLDVEEEEIFRRGEERDVPLYGDGILEQYEHYFLPIQRAYFSRYSPKEKSHLVVDNNRFESPSIL